MLLKRAYNLGPGQIIGPNWLDTRRYDIVARLPERADAEALRPMLQDLLAERFQMTLHREKKTLPVYRLTVAKDGSKLKPAKKEPEYQDAAERLAALSAVTKAFAGSYAGSPRRTVQENSASISHLVEILAADVGLPVQDRTELDGLYSFELSWVPAPCAVVAMLSLSSRPTLKRWRVACAN
jgi:uncharacterized protein (TIGR03435 family)